MTDTTFLTRQEAADVLGCHVNSVDRLADHGSLTRHRDPVRQRRRVYFLRTQVESLLVGPQPEGGRDA